MLTQSFAFGLLLIASQLLTSSPAYCRWAVEADASAALDFSNDEVEVSRDGTFVETSEEQTEILKEHARRDRGTRRLYYNSSAGEYKIVKAEVINGEKRQGVDRAMIEDKPLASHGAGFDQVNQILIAFPDIQTGSKTYLKTVHRVREVPFPGFFSRRYHFEGGIPTRAGKLHIVSELPLYVESHDPSDSLTMKESRDGDKYVLDVALKKPLYESVVDEESPSILSSEKTWIVVSSTRSHAELIKAIVPRYEAVLESKLPEAYERILSDAKKREGVVDQINAVTSGLAQAVRYMGDWRTVTGGFVPRSLETIARTQFGDCKDFASSTAAILRKLGMEANVAWVERDLQPDPLPALPLGEAFNHAIVRAKADGKVWWIDPTNFQSFAQGIFPDIIGRQSVVLKSGSEVVVETIPGGRPDESLYAEKFTLKFDKNGDANFDIRMINSGRMALQMTGAELQYSKETLNRSILTSVAKPSHVKEFKVGDYDLKSRVVRDLDFSVHVKTKNSLSRTSAGFGYTLPPPSHVDPIVNLEVSKRASAYFLAQPITYTREYALKGLRVVGKKYRGCEIQSPWMNIRRKFQEQSDGLGVKEGYEILKPRITIAELKSAEFTQFQDRLQKCFDRIQIVFQ